MKNNIFRHWTSANHFSDPNRGERNEESPTITSSHQIVSRTQLKERKPRQKPSLIEKTKLEFQGAKVAKDLRGDY